MRHLLDLARPFWPLILALVVWPIVGAALSWWLWWDTPAHWDAYAAAHPGRALAIRALRTVSPHLRKLVVAWRDYAAVRSSLPPVGIALPAAKQGALDVSATRPSVDPADEDAHASIVPPAPSPSGVAHPAQVFAPSFDPTARQTIAPEVVASIHHATTLAGRDDGQRGSTSLSAALVAMVLSGLVLSVGAMLTVGCTPARRFVLDHTDGVPARVSCVPRTQRCSVTDAGVYLPVQCSDDHREWPAMPLRPDGSQRTCAPGEGCELVDGGIARCTAADGGGR